MSLDRAGDVDKLLPAHRLAEQIIRPQQSRRDAGGAGAKPPCHRNDVALGDLKAHRNRLAAFLIKPAGGHKNEIVLADRNLNVIKRRDLQPVAFLNVHLVVHGQRNAQRVKTGTDIGAGCGYSEFQRSSPSVIG